MSRSRLNPLDAAWVMTETRATPNHVGALLIFSLPEGAPTPITTALVAAYVPAASQAGATAHDGTKARALRALARLRAMPALAGVARAIPASWQGRVKDWLRK